MANYDEDDDDDDDDDDNNIIADNRARFPQAHRAAKTARTPMQTDILAYTHGIACAASNP